MKHKALWGIGQINLFSLQQQFGIVVEVFFVFSSVFSEWIYLVCNEGNVRLIFSLENDGI